jgi:hypothetical protein
MSAVPEREQGIAARREPVEALAIGRELPSRPGLIAYLACAPAEQRKAVLDGLHSAIGNRRVTLTVRGSRGVQRAPPPFGLMQKGQVSGFAALALSDWKANPDKTLDVFSLDLLNELNTQLDTNGVPKLPAPKLDSLRAAGGFAGASWTIQFDVARTAQQPLTTKIGKIPADRISELAGIFYHECRHAEQAFLVARLVASDAKGSKTAGQIAAELDLHPPVAEAALKSTAALPGGPQGLATIQGWRAFEQGGKHHDYWDWNENLQKFVANTIKTIPSPSPADATSIQTELTKLAPVFADWRKSTMTKADTKITALKAEKNRDATDDQVLRDLTKTRAGLKKVMDAEAATIKQLNKLDARQKQTKPLTGDETKTFQLTITNEWLGVTLALAELVVVTNDAYERYPNEADAYGAQHAVQKEFATAASAPSRKP